MVARAWTGKLTLWVLSTIGLLAILAPPASAAVQQSLFAFHIGFHLGADPQVDGNGNVITLMDFDSGPNLVKFNPDAQVVWMVPMPSITFPGAPMPENFINSGCHIVLDASNNAYVDSIVDNRTFNSSVVVTRINAGGTVAWTKPYSIGPVNASEHNAPGPMAIGSDGSIYLVAHSGQQSSPDPWPTTLLRLDPSTGAERNRRAATATTDRTQGMGDTALVADAAGNIYYGGPQGLWSFSQNLQTQRWSRSLLPRALVIGTGASNGALFVTGVGSAGGLSFNMFVARLTPSNGVTAWSWSSGNESHPVGYPNTTNTASDTRAFGGNRILVDSSGQVYAGGHGVDATYRGGIVAKFDQTSGSRLWLKRYGPTGIGAGVLALAVDNLNDIYVSGQHGDFTQTVGAADRMILSPADGSQLWLLSNFVFGNRVLTHEAISQVVVDRNGNTHWKSAFDSSDQGSGEDLLQFRGPALADGTYTLAVLHSGMVLDDPNFSANAGTQMQQWPVNNNSNQRWTVTNLGSNTVRLVNQSSGLTLGVRSASTANGAAVEQNAWSGGTHQQWVVTSSATLGYFTLKNVKSGQMLDVVGASTSQGALIDQWPSNGGNNQKWHPQ